MRNLLFSEVLGPIILVAVTLVPYLYINAQTGVAKGNVNLNKAQIRYAAPANALLRVLIVALAPIGVNAAVLAAFFGMACCMGPILSMCCKKFGSVLAALAHAIAVIALIAFFEVMYVLESWSFARTLLGMIAVLAIQRFVFKLIIALALTREFKADSANIAWWNGKWYGLGWHSMSQPAREYLCKITELGLFAADFILGHVLLFFMLPFLLVPYVDKIHSIMLFWLRPSRQIRPPIYSLKQTKLRKRRVVRFAILYFALLVLFLALFIGPTIAGSHVGSTLADLINNKQPGSGPSAQPSSILGGLVQPGGVDQNFTKFTTTGPPSPINTQS